MQENIKKNMKGITLIALVVTIVILLILAGVSLNLILSNNGIISKAKDAKNKSEQDQLNIETALNNLNDWMDEQLGSTTQKPSTGIEVEIGGKTVELTKEKFGDYLGKIVTNYKDTTGTEDITVDGSSYTVSKVYRLYWIDFDNKYGDGAGTIYLKADCTGNDASLKTTGNAETSKIKNLNPHLYKNEEGEEITPPASANENMKAVTWLTDTAIWDVLKAGVNDEIPAEKINYVVGAPSLEMMMDSYNAHYQLEGDEPDTRQLTADTERTKLFYQYPYEGSTNNYGYGVGPCRDANNNNPYYTFTSDYSVKTDGKNGIDSMYYPGNIRIYWLASPSAYGSLSVCSVSFLGEGDVFSLDLINACAFCPLVSLKSNVSLKLAE